MAPCATTALVKAPRSRFESCSVCPSRLPRKVLALLLRGALRRPSSHCPAPLQTPPPRPCPGHPRQRLEGGGCSGSRAGIEGWVRGGVAEGAEAKRWHFRHRDSCVDGWGQGGPFYSLFKHQRRRKGGRKPLGDIIQPGARRRAAICDGVAGPRGQHAESAGAGGGGPELCDRAPGVLSAESQGAARRYRGRGSGPGGDVRRGYRRRALRRTHSGDVRCHVVTAVEKHCSCPECCQESKPWVFSPRSRWPAYPRDMTGVLADAVVVVALP